MTQLAANQSVRYVRGIAISRLALMVLALAAALSVMGRPAAADTATTVWSGTNTTWSNAGNWLSGVPSSSVSAVFDSTFSGQPTLTAAETTEGIWLASGDGQNVTISSTAAEVLTITGIATLNSQANAGIYMNDSGNHNLTIGPNTSIKLSNATGFYNQESTGLLTISGSINLNGKLLTIGAGATSTGNVTISGIIFGATGVTVNTAADVLFSNANLYTGATTVTAGTLQVGNAGALGTGPVTVATAGVLDLDGTTLTGTNTLALSGTLANSSNTGGTYAGLLTLGTSSTIGGTGTIYISNSGTITGAGKNLTLDGTGGTIGSNIGTTTGTVTNAAGLWTLAGVNTYTGSTTISAGTLAIGGAGQLGSGIYAGAIASNGLLLYGSSTAQTFSGVISGAGALTLNNASALLNLSNTNTYTGQTTISGGTLVLGNLSAAQLSTVSVQTASGLAFAAGIDVPTLGGLAGSGSFTLLDTSGSAVALTVGGNGAATTYSGGLSDGGLGGSMTKIGAGMLTLSGPNTYSGNTTVSGGTLGVIGSVSGGGSSTVTVDNGGTFMLSGIGYLSSGYQEFVGTSGTGTFIQSGGTNNIGTALYLGTYGGSNGEYQLSGGILSAWDEFVGNSGTGTFNQTGGWHVLTQAGGLVVGRLSSSVGTYNLNGGTLTTFQISGGSGSSTFNFNGGLLQAFTGASSNFMSGLTNAYVQSGGANIDTNGQSVTISQPLIDGGGGGGLTKIGAGTLTLTGSNTYSGTTTISAGTLAIGGAGQLGSGIYAGAIANSGLLLYNSTAPQTFSGVISGSGALAQSGGSLTLAGNNNYTGATKVDAGTLMLTGSGSLGSSAVTVSGGATFGVYHSTSSTNTMGGNLTLNAGSVFSMADGATSTLSVSGNAALGASNFVFDLGGATSMAADQLAITGSAAITKAGEKIAINPIGTTAGTVTGSYTLISGSSNSTLATNPLGLLDQKVYFNGTPYFLSLASASTLVTLNVGNFVGTDQAYWTGSAGSAWSASTTGSFNTSAGGSAQISGSLSGFTDVFFSTTTPSPGNLTNSLTANSTINSLNFLNSSGAVTIGGTKTLTINAVGVGNFGISDSSSSPQTINVPITLGGGTLGAGPQTWTNSGGGLLTTGSSIANGGNLLTLNTTAGGGNITLAGILSGSGGLTAAGNGIVTLSASNTYTGGTTISGGTLNFGNVSAMGTASVTFAANSTLQAGIASGTVANAIVLNPSVTGTFDTQGFGPTLSGIISGSGALTKIGGGILTLTGSNTFTGAIIVSAGTLSIPSGYLSGSGPLTVASGALFTTTVNDLFNGGTAGQPAGAWTIAGTISNTAANAITMPADVQLNNGTISGLGNSNYGAFFEATIGGTITASGTSAITTRNLGVGSSFLALNTPAATDLLTVSAALGGTTSSAGGVIKLGYGLVNLTGSNIYTGNTTISGGTLQIGGGGALGYNGIASTANYAASIIDNALLVYGSSAAQSFSGAISGAGVLTQSGAGMLTLSGSNTYSGGTTMNNGALVLADGPNTSSVFSALGTGPLTLNGGTLAAGPAGSVAGLVQAGNAPHTLAPGYGLASGFGTLNLNGGLTTSASTTLSFNLGTSTTESSNSNTIYLGDLLNVGTALTVGASTNLNFSLAAPNLGDYRLIGLTGGATLSGSSNFNILPTPPPGDKYSLSTAVDPGYIDMVLSFSGSATGTTYTLSASSSVSAIRTTSGSSAITATITNTGGSLADTLSYMGLNVTASGGTLSGGTLPKSGSSPLANQGGSDFGTTCFASNTAGSYSIAPLVASASNATLGGAATFSGSQGTTVNVYDYANPVLSGSTASFGNVRAGATASVTIGNVVISNSAYQDSLNFAAGNGGNGNLTVSNSGNLLAGSSGTITFTAAAAGPLAATSVVSLTSSDNGVANLNNAPLTSGTISVTGAAYRYSSGSLDAATTAINLGAVHAGYGGGSATYNVNAVNTASSDGYSDALRVSFSNGFSGSGASLVSVTSGGTAAAGSGSQPVAAITLSTSAGGMVSGSYNVALVSVPTVSGLDTGHVVGSGTVNVSASVFSGSGTWNGSSGAWGSLGNNNWTDSNGSGIQAAPGTFAGFTNTDGAVFSGSGSVTAIDLTGVNPSLNSLSFSNSSYTLSNGSLTLNGSTSTASVTVGSGTQTINTPISLASNANFAINGGALLLNSTISGSGGFTKSGLGGLALMGGNLYTGLTTISAGTLRLGNAAALGSGGLTVGASGTLDLAGISPNAVPALSGAAGGVITDSSLPASPVIPTMFTVNIASGGSTYGGAIFNGGSGQSIALTKTGYGALTLAGTSNYTGGTTIYQGTLNVTGVLAGGGNVVIATGATLAGSGMVDGEITGAAGAAIIATGNLVLGDNTSYTGFNHAGTLAVGANTVTLNSAQFANVGISTTLSGGTLRAPNGIYIGGGCALSGSGVVNGRIAAGYGSTINATGTLTLGDSTSPAGFSSDGELYTGANTVTLQSKSQAVLGSLTQIGDNNGNSGTLVVANGIVLDYGNNLVGQGTVNTPNTLAGASIINGNVDGTGSGLNFTGYIKGAGAFSGSVTLSGSYSLGSSPAAVPVQNLLLAPTSTLIMEYSGELPGSGYDQLEISELATLNGTLDVTPLNGFSPTLGESFELFNGPTTGTFEQVNLPTLSNGLSWDTSNLYTNGTISVVPEPSTWLLLGVGAIGLLGYCWRRRTTRAAKPTATDQQDAPALLPFPSHSSPAHVARRAA